MNYSFNEARPALEVFHTGDSVRAYDFLGAHLVNRNDKNGVVFRVWAPTARSVSVAGDFNNWNNEANYMYNIGYGVWEVFVEGVKEFCTYSVTLMRWLSRSARMACEMACTACFDAQYTAPFS